MKKTEKKIARHGPEPKDAWYKLSKKQWNAQCAASCATARKETTRVLTATHHVPSSTEQ